MTSFTFDIVVGAMNMNDDLDFIFSILGEGKTSRTTQKSGVVFLADDFDSAEPTKEELQELEAEEETLGEERVEEKEKLDKTEMEGNDEG